MGMKEITQCGQCKAKEGKFKLIKRLNPDVPDKHVQHIADNIIDHMCPNCVSFSIKYSEQRGVRYGEIL